MAYIFSGGHYFELQHIFLLTPSSVSAVACPPCVPFGDSRFWPLRGIAPRECPTWLALDSVDA